MTGVVTQVADAAQAHRLVAAMRAEQPLPPFAEPMVAFCAALSRALSRSGRDFPEITALAFWTRRSELERMRVSFAERESEESLLVPRGTVLHFPPANVDTIFVYSWLLAALVGNRNVIRLSERLGPAAQHIIDVAADVLPDHPDVAARTALVRYGHDSETTVALSSACDVRVIWGGDESVRRIREIPLPAHATELTFPDRSSLAAISTEWYVDLGEGERDELAERLFNDAYWFDQRGCASPRLVAWVGRADHTAAAEDFFGRLAAVTRSRNYVVEASTHISKYAYALAVAAESPLPSGLEMPDPRVTVLKTRSHLSLGEDFCGAGMFISYRIERLSDLASSVTRRDQTLVHAGFTQGELVSLARQANGQGLDRLVPFGEALQFDRVWDGHDLMDSFSRRVTVRTRRS